MGKKLFGAKLLLESRMYMFLHVYVEYLEAHFHWPGKRRHYHAGIH